MSHLNNKTLMNSEMVIKTNNRKILQILTPSFSKIVAFTNTLTFEVKDCDPTTGEADPEGYNDEYQVEDIEVTTSDYIRASYISNFAEEYENLVEGEIIDTFALDREKAPSLKGKIKKRE